MRNRNNRERKKRRKSQSEETRSGANPFHDASFDVDFGVVSRGGRFVGGNYISTSEDAMRGPKIFSRGQHHADSIPREFRLQASGACSWTGAGARDSPVIRRFSR